MKLRTKTNQYFFRRYRQAEYSCLSAGALSVTGAVVALFGGNGPLELIGVAAALWFALVAILIFIRTLIPGRYLLFRFGSFEQTPVADSDLKALRVAMAHTPEAFDNEFVHQVDRIRTYADFNAVMAQLKSIQT